VEYLTKNSRLGKQPDHSNTDVFLANCRRCLNGSLFGSIGSTAAGDKQVSTLLGAVDPIERESAPFIGLTGKLFSSGGLSPDYSRIRALLT